MIADSNRSHMPRMTTARTFTYMLVVRECLNRPWIDRQTDIREPMVISGLWSDGCCVWCLCAGDTCSRHVWSLAIVSLYSAERTWLDAIMCDDWELWSAGLCLAEHHTMRGDPGSSPPRWYMVHRDERGSRQTERLINNY